MDKEFCELTLETLNLNLIDLRGRQVERLLEFLTIYPKSRFDFEFRGQKITLAVIGESHFLLVWGKFMELLMCKVLPDQAFDDLLVIDRIWGKQIVENPCFYHIPKFAYHFQARLVPYWQTAAIQQSGKTIFHHEEEFPFSLRGEEIPCQTRLHLSQINASTLFLQTRHDYPSPDGKSIISASSFSIQS